MGPSEAVRALVEKGWRSSQRAGGRCGGTYPDRHLNH
jgi:hypothetical protein